MNSVWSFFRCPIQPQCVLQLLPRTHCQAGRPPQRLPEVAAAKNAHLAALRQQHSYGGDYGYEGSHGEEHRDSHGDIRYHGPNAIPHVLHDGHIADTHEMTAAKAKHLAAVAKAKAHGGYGGSGGYTSGSGANHGHSHHVAPYHGPLTKPVVFKSGYLADTNDVAVAREHHLEALHGASQHNYGHHN